ncbi:MAG: protein kinase, partial [Verrucomicrobiales bacterium]|nr:protein kinase [Verrucomicrobiales bacterium]
MPDLTPFPGPPVTFQAPSEWADYFIQDRIGEGAMGVVYRARKISLRKDVAIKFMKAGRQASDRQRALFMREAQLASHLEHPHIVTVSEVGERDGTLFLVMRLVEG